MDRTTRLLSLAALRRPVDRRDKATEPKSLENITGSIFCQVLHGTDDIVDLGQDLVLKRRRIGYECIKRRDTPDRTVKEFEKLIGDPGGNFGAISPGAGVLIHDQTPARFGDRLRDALPVIRAKGSQVQNLDTDAVFFFQLLGRDHGSANRGPEG